MGGGGCLWVGGCVYIHSSTPRRLRAPLRDHFTTHPPTHPPVQALSGDKPPDKSQGPLTGALASLGWRAEQVYKF